MKSNNIIIGVLVVAIVIMSVAFAAFSTTLKINGSASIDSRWELFLTEPSDACTITTQKDSGKAPTCEATVSEGSVTATIGFASPGDVVTLKFRAFNSGTLKASASLLAKMYLTSSTSSNCTNVTTQGYVTSFADTGTTTTNSDTTTITATGQTIGPVNIRSINSSASACWADYTFTFTYNANATSAAGNCTFTGTLNATQAS